MGPTPRLVPESSNFGGGGLSRPEPHLRGTRVNLARGLTGETGFPREASAPQAREALTPVVRDRCAPVAAEGLLAESDSRRSLTALVFRAVDHRDGALDELGVEAVGAQLLGGAILLHVGGEHLVEQGVGG